jgi:tRNA (guanine-N7-)-methyltransferase
LVKQLARELKPGARVYLQSDVGSLTEDMRDKFERYGSEYFGLDADLYDVEAAAAKAAEAAKVPVEPVDEKDDGWRSGWAHAGWLDKNPIGIPSEREVQTLGEGLPVFRVMLRRNENAF